MNRPKLASMFRKVRRQIGGPGDLFLAIRMLGWALCLRVLKYLVPLPRLVDLVKWPSNAGRLEPFRANGPSRSMLVQRGLGPTHQQQIVTLARWTCRLTAWSAGGNCLERGLVTYRYLSAIGADPTLVVGVGNGGTGVRGHVWVVVDGRPITEEALSEFHHVLAFASDGARLPAFSH